jgi:DnaD/phage-associated family protein
MQKFPGFPVGSKLSPTAFPTSFFSDLLPMIDDLAELKVTLFCFWALHQKEGRFRYLRPADFAGNAALMQGLTAAAPEQPPETTLANALTRAGERGTLLCVEVQLDSGSERLYFVNTQLGRAAVEQIKIGAWQPGDAANPVAILPERPNIYRLYEANIGALTPMIADALKDAEKDYPLHWIEDAIKEAVENNKRSWRYIQAILKRWETEGKSREISGRRVEQAGQQYVSGQFADFIEH